MNSVIAKASIIPLVNKVKNEPYLIVIFALYYKFKYKTTNMNEAIKRNPNKYLVIAVELIISFSVVSIIILLKIFLFMDEISLWLITYLND